MGLARNTLRKVAGSSPVSRWLFWWRLARRTSPSPRGALWESALVDLLRYGWRARRPLPVARRPFSVTLRNGTRFEVRAGTDDPMNVYPGREEDAERAILDPLRGGGKVLVDAGANIGFYSSQAAGLGSSFVLAVEANPRTAAQCRRNLERNAADGSFRLETVAVGEQVGTTRFWVPAGSSSQGRVTEAVGGNGESIEVPLTTLDELTRDLPAVDVLKLDIEGHELSALRGAAGILARTRRVVCECNQDKHEIVVLLTGAGFCVRSLAFTTYVVGDRE
jgi:FkbM family methyltransferase